MIDSEILQKCTMEEIAIQSLSVTDDIKQKIKDHYARLESRYGPTIAKIILGSALVGCLSPIPGSSFIMALPFVGLGELVLWLKDNPKAHEDLQKTYEDEVNIIIQSF